MFLLLIFLCATLKYCGADMIFHPIIHNWSLISCLMIHKFVFIFLTTWHHILIGALYLLDWFSLPKSKLIKTHTQPTVGCIYRIDLSYITGHKVHIASSGICRTFPSMLPSIIPITQAQLPQLPLTLLLKFFLQNIFLQLLLGYRLILLLRFFIIRIHYHRYLLQHFTVSLPISQLPSQASTLTYEKELQLLLVTQTQKRLDKRHTEVKCLTQELAIVVGLEFGRVHEWIYGLCGLLWVDYGLIVNWRHWLVSVAGGFLIVYWLKVHVYVLLFSTYWIFCSSVDKSL